MNAMLILLVSVVVLVLGYVLYGGWLARQWGVKADRTTPAHEYEDGRDFVPAPPYVVLGHHFSSIAGAGPINGPIQAAVFGWVPVLLWVLIGGIFIGAMHDFGALFASIRHKGQTLATVIQENVDGMAKRLFCIFAYLTLILVVAAFASIVAGTFAVSPVPADAAKAATVEMTNLANTRTAMISVLFIVVAVVFGLATRGRKIPVFANVLSAIVIIVLVVTLGFAAGLSQMLGMIPGLAGTTDIAYALLILAVSVFCLTSLDTATRLARYMFQELFTPQGVEISELTGWRKAMTNPWVATIITVVLGVGLSMTGYQLVWPLFGAANQLLAALGLLAVCAWLGNAGRNNKMFYVPMAFMLIVTLTSLGMTLYAKGVALAGGALDAATVLQLLIALLLIILAVILAVKGFRTIFGRKGPGGPGDGGEATSSARANPADEPFENANLGFEDLNI